MADQLIDFSLHPESNDSRLLDAKILQALEDAPVFDIPADFAARIASHASRKTVSHYPFAISNVSVTVRHHGRNAAIVSMGVLLVLILAFAHRASSASALWATMEAIFCVQFALLAVWLVARDMRQYLPWSS